MAAVKEISQLLNTGLDDDTLKVCVQLLEAGVNPEALAAVVRELRRETASLADVRKVHYLFAGYSSCASCLTTSAIRSQALNRSNNDKFSLTGHQHINIMNNESRVAAAIVRLDSACHLFQRTQLFCDLAVHYSRFLL